MPGIELIIQFPKLLFQLFFFSEHAETLTGFACFVHRVFISPKIVFFPFFIFCVFAIFWAGKVFVPLCDPAFQKVMILVKINITRRNDGTIVAVSEGSGVSLWGKLKSGIGWLSLDFCRRFLNWITNRYRVCGHWEKSWCSAGFFSWYHIKDFTG